MPENEKIIFNQPVAALGNNTDKKMNAFRRKITHARKVWKEQGWRGIKRHAEQQAFFRRETRNYQKWILEFDELTGDDRRRISQNIENFSHKPLLSVVMPVYNVKEKWLRRCIESVIRQIYANWEFCIADDASSAPHIRKILDEYAAQDARFKIVFREKNGHISAASNSALELADGEFAVLLDHDDELHETALYHVAQEINRHPATEMIYSDEDLIDERGRRFAPKFKPDWSPDFFNSLNLITHLSAYRTAVLRKIGGFRVGTEGSQDYDLALRVTEEIRAENIRHIPRVLYHWRAIQGSVALDADEKPYAHDRAKRAIQQHFEREGIAAKVTNGYSHLHRAVYQIPENTFISIIFCAENSAQVEKISARINDEKTEIIAVGKETKNLARVKFVEPQKTAAESLNRAAAAATGDVLIFLDAGVEPLNSDWMRELASLAVQSQIGAVGGKILNADATVRNAGIILGARGAIGFAHRRFLTDALGNFLRLVLINNFSAVSGAFAVRREIFGDGFDAENFPNGLYEIDFCLRLRRERKLRNVFTPYAEFLQTSESATEKSLRENSPEVSRFKEKWKGILEKDPYYNPNLSLADESFSISLAPRIGKI
ncbi:MAG: glycosyltransferase family 2 protein [Pyrinomonadaceae bacterium]